jgi:hypothetical protein
MMAPAIADFGKRLRLPNSNALQLIDYRPVIILIPDLLNQKHCGRICYLLSAICHFI